jgi:hypothetical protein
MRQKQFVTASCVFYVAFTFLLGEHKVTRGEDGIRSLARDTGLLMKITREFDPFLLNVHSLTGLGLVIAMLVQKYWILENIKSAKTKKNATKVEYFRTLHSLIGLFILLSMLVMAIAGYLLGKNSDFSSFGIFSVLFAFPWVFWVCAIAITAFIYKSVIWHNFFADMAFKGCLAVPCARIAGTLLQRFTSLSDESGFYTGILLTSIAFAVWQGKDLIILLNVLKKQKFN